MGTSGSTKLRIGILDPYLDTLGGGERYILSIAKAFSNCQIDLFWPDESIKSVVKQRLNINIDHLRLKKYKKKLLNSSFLFPRYDLFFYVTDGSLFFSPARKSYLIIQSPAHVPSVKSKLNRLKMKTWSKLFCYSQYVRKFLKDQWKDADVVVLPPGIDTNLFKPRKKQNIILSTGRFFSHLHSKKQVQLIDWFRHIYTTKVATNWRLVLIGSVTEDAHTYLREVTEKARGIPVEIIANADFNILNDYYSKAKIFWLATGYGENLSVHPEKAEHFGIVTIEAMSAGCVPIVFAAGGPKEILDHGKSGFLFLQEDDLLNYTTRLIKDETLRKQMSKEAIVRSQQFNMQTFKTKLHEITRT